MWIKTLSWSISSLKQLLELYQGTAYNSLMMISCSIKSFFAFILAAAFGLNCFFSYKGDAYALSCLPEPTVLFAAYEQGNFIDGFTVKYVCLSGPTVSEGINNLQSVFTTASQGLDSQMLTGVYQLTTSCVAGNLNESCAKAVVFEQLSNNPSEFARYKSEWQVKESEWKIEQQERSRLREQLPMPVFFSVIIPAILAPWILAKVWPNSKRRLLTPLIVAILLQTLLALFLIGFQTTMFALPVFLYLIPLYLFVLIPSFISDVVFLVVRKTTSKNVVSKSNISDTFSKT